MSKYKFKIEEIWSNEVIVEANSQLEAYEKATAIADTQNIDLSLCKFVRAGVTFIEEVT